MNSQVPSGDQFISVGQDKTIKIGRMDQLGEEADTESVEVEAPLSIVGKNFYTGVDHHRRRMQHMRLLSQHHITTTTTTPAHLARAQCIHLLIILRRWYL